MFKVWAFFWLAITLVFGSSCALPFVIAGREIATDQKGEFKYTRRQAKVAVARAQLHIIGKFDKEKGMWTLHPESIGVEDAKKVLENQAKSADALLSYRNMQDSDFIDWFKGFREGLLKEEQIALWILRRLQYVSSYNQFVDMVGEMPPEMRGKEYEYFFASGRKSYSIRMIYPLADITKIPFSAAYVENAKRDGTLKLVDSFTVTSDRKFGKKEVNIHDPNDFSWKEVQNGWVINSYRILPDKEKPLENNVHYIEVFRTDGSRALEPKPAVKGFMASGESKVSVFVIDYDRSGKDGFGSPDEIYKIFSGISTGSEIYDLTFYRGKVLLSLFDPPNASMKPERRKPPERPVYTEIVKMGELQLDMWEKGSWALPAVDFRSLKENVSLVFDKAKTPAEMQLEKEGLSRVKSIKQEYSKDNQTVVIKYWLPKQEYAERNITYNNSAFGDTIRLRRRGGQEETGEAGYFGKRVTAIDYFFAGRWFRIVDEDGDGVFEKRKTISSPVEVSFEPESVKLNFDMYDE
ncbi:hypothetical protein HYT01_01350 [Candidatus Giovannonibacteria bacterium]|nr:hypothetical protein [Candidatus Giovannonibacteria bacterium]